MQSLAEADLTGYSDRFTPEQRKAREELEKQGLTLEQRQEVEKLDALIAKAIAQCERGSVLRGGKRNPGFGHLATLVKTRKYILDNARKQAKNKSSMDELAEITSRYVKEHAN